jgi:hypothetical protein
MYHFGLFFMHIPNKKACGVKKQNVHNFEKILKNAQFKANFKELSVDKFTLWANS